MYGKNSKGNQYENHQKFYQYRIKSAFSDQIQNDSLNHLLDDVKMILKNIIAFVNPKSGGQKGQIAFEKILKYLPEENVFDLTKGGPKLG
jgi:hypothetical protein